MFGNVVTPVLAGAASLQSGLVDTLGFTTTAAGKFWSPMLVSASNTALGTQGTAVSYSASGSLGTYC
jgi:hypothetical protein